MYAMKTQNTCRTIKHFGELFSHSAVILALHSIYPRSMLSLDCMPDIMYSPMAECFEQSAVVLGPYSIYPRSILALDYMHDMIDSPLNKLYPLVACWSQTSTYSNGTQPTSADFYSIFCADTEDQAMLPS